MGKVAKKQKPVLALGIANPLDPLSTRTRREFAPGCTVRQCVTEIWPLLPDGRELVIAVDGVVREDAAAALDEVLAAGQSLVFSARPQGGGGGKDVFGTVGMLALMIAAPGVGSLIGGALVGTAAWGPLAATAAFLGTNVAGLIGGAFSLGMGALVSAFTGTGATTTNATAAASTAESPSWSDAPNPVAEGGVWPAIYGTAKVKPTVISWHKTYNGDDQYLHWLGAIADHAVDSIDQVFINGNPLAFYGDGITVEQRLGAFDQEPVSFFNETVSEKTANMEVSTEWATARTDGNACQGLAVVLCWDQGLGYIGNQGSFTDVTETFSIQYRKVGDTEWTPLSGSTQSTDKGAWAFATNYAVGDAVTHDGTIYYCLTQHTSVAEYITTGGYIDPETGTWIEPTTTPTGYTFANDSAYWSTTFTAAEVELSVTGATGSAMYKVFRADNVDADGAQFDVRVKFTKAPESGSRYRTRCWFAAIQEIIYDDFAYPGRSVLGLKIKANDLISSSTSLTVEAVVTRSTVPVWTGSAYEAKPANNPAWAAWDFEHNGEYGGNVPYGRIVLPAFEDWAEWLETKPLYRVNLCMDSSSTHKSWMEQIAMLGRGSVVQIGTKFTAIVERPEPAPAQRFLFNVANIRRNSFKLEMMDSSERANCVEVTYKEAATDYSEQTVTLYADGYENFDQTKTASVKLLGCTSAAQALAHARFLLNKNRCLTNTVTLGANVNAIGVWPGQVIDVGHDVPQWGFGGRIVSTTDNVTVAGTTTATVVLDREVTLEVGTNYALQAQMMDDTRLEYPVQGVTGTTITDTLTILGGWDADGQPEDDSLYQFGPVGLVSKPFTALTINSADDFTRTITGLEYNADIFNDDVPVPDVVNPSSLAGVTGLVAVETFTVVANAPVPRVDLTWLGTAMQWTVAYREANAATWITLGTTREQYWSIDAARLTPGRSYDFRVTGNGDSRTSSIFFAGGPTPPDVSGLYEFAQGGNAFIAADTADVPWSVTYVVRKGSAWDTAQLIGEYTQPLAQIHGAGTYWMAIRCGVVYSTTPRSITVTAEGLAQNVIAVADEAATGWTGDKTDGLVVVDGALRFIGLGDLYDVANLYAETDLYALGGFVAQATYTIPEAHRVELSEPSLCRIIINYEMRGDGVASDIYAIPDMWAVPDLFGSFGRLVSAVAQIRVYRDGAWGEWAVYQAGDYYGEKFDARLVLATGDTTVTPVVSEFVFSVDVPDRDEWEKGVSIPVEGYPFAYDKPFNAVPATVVQILDAQAGDTVNLPLALQTVSGGFVSITNGGVAVARNANLIHRGY